MELAGAKVEAENAEKILASVKSVYEAAKLQPVKAPPDAYVWSLIAGPGDFVRAGAPVATWVDCGFMLVDVPVSDVELALLDTDAPARVIIEGDHQVRLGKVYLTRGAAATAPAAEAEPPDEPPVAPAVGGGTATPASAGATTRVPAMPGW